MVEGIFHTYLVLIAIISLNQPLPSSEKKTISPEDEEEAVQRMKEREVILQQYHLHLEKEIEDLEARQASLAWPLWELERKIRWHTCAVFCLVVPVVFMIWRQRWNVGIGEQREEETELGLLGKVWKGVAFLTKPSVLYAAIYICTGGIIDYFELVADGLLESPLKLLRSRRKKLVLNLRLRIS